MKKIYFLLTIVNFFLLTSQAQTNPTPQTIPYAQDFSALAHNSTTYPAGWQGWVISTSPGGTFNTSSPASDRVLFASSAANLNSGNIHNYNGKIGFLNTGSLDLGLVLSVNTTGQTDVAVAYDIMTIRNPHDGGANTRINEVTLQYRIGTTGAFTNLTGIEYQNNTTTQTTAVTTPQNVASKALTLPSTADNQPVVQLRWASRQVSGGGSRPSFAIDNVSVGAAVVDVTPPVVSALNPADNAINVALTATATITFNESVAKGTSGTITVKRSSDNVIVQTLDITSAAVTVAGSNVSFDLSGLAVNTSYYVEVSANAFKDLANNSFAGISGNTAWNFTTAPAAAGGVVGTTYSFNTCTNPLPDGFIQFSVTGPQVWACTTFGHSFSNPSASAPNGVQINGFASGTNVPNEDWLISPAYDLTSTAFPLLSFWSRNAFNGDPLELKISTDYVSGNPNLATWTDLNGKFPNQASDIWTLSNNINLSAFKTTNVRIAFVYNSSDDDGARWTLDDITVTNSATPPPASLSVSTTDIQFGFVANPGSSVETFTFTANDITGPLTVTASSNFTVSKNNVDFTPSLSYLQAEANNVTSTVYVRFTPPANGQDYTGTATLSTQGLADTVVNLRGTSIDPVNTLEVVNWNIEWFGSSSLGPTNDAQQQANVVTILTDVAADIYGLTEVVSETRLQAVVSQMPGYAYVLSNYGSHTNTSANSPSALAEAQKLAFVYKTSIFSNVTATPLLSQGINSAADLINPAYNYFASGRFPYMMTADVTLNGVTKTVRFVLIHGKANTSPTATSYARRKAGSDTLAFTLNSLFPNDRILILGDFNDDLDRSITAGFTTTSYSAFTTDNVNFFAPTLALSLAGKKSTVSYNDVIDHVVVSNEMQCYYMNATANILTGVTSLVSNYASTTSDHYPVFTRYAFTPGPSATFSYSGTAFCQNAGIATPTFAGTANGTYSAGTGLTINPTTGVVTLSSSTPGTYTITYTIAATTCDPVYTATSMITVTIPPTATVAYSGSPYCQSTGTAAVTIAGTSGGTFTSTSGLTINATTGAITTTTSTPGTYTVNYTIPASSNCAPVIVTTTVTVTRTPNATISYSGSPFCPGTATITPTITGSTGGTFSSTTGLTINASTGAITLATSTAGTYVITYRIAASGGCAVFNTTATVVINAASIAPTGATASVSTLCGQGTVNLAVQFATGSLGTGATWKWYSGSCGGTLIGTGATLSNIPVSTTTTFYVRAEGTCNTTTCASVTVTVNDQPNVTISAAPYTSLLPGLTTTLTANVTAASTNTLTWYLNGVPVAGNSSNTITASVDQLGNYYASVTTVNNCIATSNTILIRDSISDKLFITPNPNRGIFNVRYGSPNGQAISRILSIYDSKGARVFSKLFVVANSFSSMNVNLSGHGKGTYFIIVSDVSGNKLTEGSVLVL